MIRQITAPELETLYETRMKADFPADELRPLWSLKRLMDRGQYLCYNYGEGAAYALIVYTGGNVALLDYFAVNRERRGQGIGGKALAAIRAALKEKGVSTMMLEVERVDTAVTPEQTRVRERRIAFYLKNGCGMTGVASRQFSVAYSILCLGDRPEDALTAAWLNQIYPVLLRDMVANKKLIGFYANAWVENA